MASVLVSVMDVNDNSPEFSSAEYSGVVTENSGRGAKIIRVGATDRDLNRTITYSLAGGSKEIFQFPLNNDLIAGKPRFSRLVSINKDTGDIYVAGSIDREVFTWINLTVTATDSGWPARSSQTGVFIKVMKN